MCISSSNLNTHSILEGVSRTATLWQRWVQIAESAPEREAIVWLQAGKPSVRWSFGGLVEAALCFGGRLRAAGVNPGEICALVVRHHPDFYPLYLGIKALGAVPAVLAYPNERLHPDKFREGLSGMARRSGLDWLITERDLEWVVSRLALGTGTTLRGILFGLEANPGEVENEPLSLSEAMEANADPSAPAVLQHSSGTTGLQKAVVLSNRAILEHLCAYAQAIDLGSTDKVASWLPLYHDMGLIAGFHLPLATGIASVQIDPFEWVCAPILLFEAISSESCTLTWLPNFAYNLMADRIHEEELEGIRLDSLRMVVNCSEPVRAESHQRFIGRFRPIGLGAEALAACYAMAESTFAVTQTVPGTAPRLLLLDREALSRGFVSPQRDGQMIRRCVSSGRVIKGCGVRIVGELGEDLPEGQVGEILIRSEYMFDGYRNWPEKTAEVLRGGWYHSGDLGFQLGEDLFVIGRKKDIIIVAGKNIYPEDIEDIISNVPGVLAGRVVAFGMDDEALGTEKVAVVAETSIKDDTQKKELRRQIIEAVMATDVTVAVVILVPSRWLIKSSAGKPSRRANRERIGELLRGSGEGE